MPKNIYKLYLKKNEVSSEVNSTFFYKELLFLLLPLLILFPVKFIFGKNTPLELIASSEFSFIVIILLAQVISDFIEFKTKFQRNTAYNFFDGIKMYILFLLIATIALAFNLLNELGLTKYKMSELGFAFINCGLFFLGVFSLFLKVLYQVSHKFCLSMIREFNDKYEIRNILFRETNDVKDKLLHITYALESFEITENKIDPSNPEYHDSKKYNEEITNDIMRAIEDSVTLLEIAKSKFSERRGDLEK